MRADSLSCLSCSFRRFLRWGCIALLSLTLVGIGGCKTEQDAEDPYILGIPPN